MKVFQYQMILMLYLDNLYNNNNIKSIKQSFIVKL